jgi:two-component system chemotaxis sensor kinase CheA
LIELSNQKFVVPSAQISEIKNCEDVQIREVLPSQFVFQMRDELIELSNLPKLLVSKLKTKNVVSAEKSQREMILIVEVENKKVGFLAHKIIGIQRVVQKPLSLEMTVCPGSSGVTILGDGSPAIILDLRQLAMEHVLKKEKRARVAS